MKRRGYTLFEMIIVVALICLLAGLATPPIMAMYDDYRLQAAVDEVAGRWSAIRARAITEGRPYRFSIQSESGDFRVGPDAPEFWSGGDAPAATGPGNQAPLVVQDTLPKGIRFVMGNAGDASSAGAPARATPATLPTRVPEDGPPWRCSCPTARRSRTPIFVCRPRSPARRSSTFVR